MIKIRRVAGGSMKPTLDAGTIVISVKKKPKLGNIVIARAESREVVKRVVGADESTFELAGDNPASSRYRNVAGGDILGVIIWPKQKSR